MTVSPLGTLLPLPNRRRAAPATLAQQPDPLATMLASATQDEGGLIPVSQEGFGEEIEEAPAPAAAPATASPQAAISPINEPPANTDTPSSPWGSWLGSSSNRDFLYGLGVQLMLGGRGNFMQQLAAGLAAGSATAAGAEQSRTREAQLAAAEEARSTGGGRRRGGYRGAGRARFTPASVPITPVAVNPQLAQVEQFIQSNPSPEAWAAANQPGGLIYAVFGGPQDQTRASELLQLVQAETQRPQGPAVGRASDGLLAARRGRLTPEQSQELIALGSSRDQADRATFQALAGYHFGNGYEYFVDANGISRRRTPLASRPPRTAETAFSQAAAGGIDAARLTINNVRDYLSGSVTSLDPTGISGMVERGAQQQTGAGAWARIMASMKDGVMSYVHSRSGAQVSVREFDHYLTTRMPQLGDSERTIQYKLADLELALMLIARRRGEPVAVEQLFEMYNRGRQFSNLPAVTMEQFTRILPAEERARGIQPGANAAPTQLPAAPPARPTPSAPVPPTAGPESLQPRAAPAPGTIMQGYRFKGGDPSKPENWEPVR